MGFFKELNESAPVVEEPVPRAGSNVFSASTQKHMHPMPICRELYFSLLKENFLINLTHTHIYILYVQIKVQSDAIKVIFLVTSFRFFFFFFFKKVEDM